MRSKNGSFPGFQWRTMQENVRQFKGNDYKTNRSFVIAVGDDTVLKRTLNCRTDKLPGFDKSRALIVTRPGGHRELFIDPRARNHREMQLAFLDALGIFVPASVAREYQSDHAFPASAADPSIGLVRAQLIPQPANSTFGASIEKFSKGRSALLDNNGIVPGHLLDLGKAQGFPLVGPDIEENMDITIEMLIGSGLAPAGDRQALTASKDDAMVALISGGSG